MKKYGKRISVLLCLALMLQPVFPVLAMIF